MKMDPNGRGAYLYADENYVYVAWFRHWRSGKIIYASEHGLRAFRIPIRKRRG